MKWWDPRQLEGRRAVSYLATADRPTWTVWAHFAVTLAAMVVGNAVRDVVGGGMLGFAAFLVSVVAVGLPALLLVERVETRARRRASR